MRESYRRSAAAPYRLPLLDKRVQPFVGILRLHELFEIEALDLSETLIEIGTLRDTKCTLRETQRRRALLVQTRQPLLGAAIEFCRRKNGVGDFLSIDCFASQQKLEALSRRHLTRK